MKKEIPSEIIALGAQISKWLSEESNPYCKIVIDNCQVKLICTEVAVPLQTKSGQR